MKVKSRKSSTSRRAAAVAAAVLLSLALFGCSSGGSDAASDKGEEADAPEKVEVVQVEYFEEDGGIVVPSSILNLNQVAKRTTTSNGVLQKTVYEYSLASEGAESLAEVAKSYVDALEDEGMTIEPDGDLVWNVVANKQVSAVVSVEDTVLKVSLIPASQRTNFESITLNQTIEKENYTFTLTGVEWVKELYPEDTSGGYNYYPEQPNKTYCVVKGIFKYTGGNAFDFDNTKASFSFNDKYNYSASPEYESYNAVGYSQINNFYSLAPFDEVKLDIYASVADEVYENLEKGELTWIFLDGTEYRLTF